jgi:DNA polymerase I
MNRFTASENLLSDLSSGKLLALTAPLVIDQNVLLGYAASPEEAYCVDIPLNEFTALCPSLYLQVNAPRIFHGLKRIWEFLDDRDLRTDTDTIKDLDINKIEDTKLLAYLLDPDSAREVEFGEHRVQEELTLAHLSALYLGDEYPYRNTDIYESRCNEAFAEILVHDARLIYRLAAELPGRMSKDLYRLYRDLELPLMFVLDNIRRVGIGVDGETCAREVNRIERETAILAQEITGGEDIDLRSDREVFRFLVKRGVRFQDQRVYQWGRVTNKALEEIAPIYPVVQDILSFREKGQDLGSLRQMADQDRVHPVWGQTRSATSRIYARNPAVQNVSRQLRHLFIPAPGHVLIKADYSQAQMRILAHLSKDPELMKIFNNPTGDVHAETSRRLGLNDRNIAKEINFAISFGMGAAGLCSKINELKKKQGRTDFVGLDGAQSYIEGFYRRFPKVKEFFDQEWEKLKKLASQERVVRSLLGRERRFQRRPSSEVERRFRVTWPQQIEADLIKTAMVRLDRILRRRNMKARIVMMIHDALWVEAPHEEAEPVKHLLRKMMITASKLTVPLEVDIK